MDSLLQFILDLFSNESAAQSFVADPNAALANAGLADVSPEQIQSVAASAIPGLQLAGVDPVSSLAQTVSDQYGFAPVAEAAPVAQVLSDEALQVGADAGYRLAAAVGEGFGAGLGSALGGGLETGLGLGGGRNAVSAASSDLGSQVGLGTGLGIGGGAEIGGGFEAGLGTEVGVGTGLGTGFGVGGGAEIARRIRSRSGR